MKINGGLLRIWLACNLFALTYVDAAVNDVCRTTEAMSGTCVLLTDCARLYALYSVRPMPRTTSVLLRAEQCGRIGRNPLVCCRDEVKKTTTTTTIRTTRIDPGPEVIDVSTHPNVGMINPDSCGMTSLPRIVGGEKAELFEMPWMALLKYRATDGRNVEESFKCGGALINSRYILTAAHCISKSTRLRLLSVRLGELDTSTDVDCENHTQVCAPPPQNIEVEKMIRHPAYRSASLVNDIALIRLAAPADTDVDSINSICLPVGLDAQNKNLDGTRLVVAGWGITEDGTTSPDLLKVNLPVMSNERCKEVFRSFDMEISSKQLCAGGTNKKDSCRGDSGGPLKTYGRANNERGMMQYGVVSYGHSHCGTEGVPGVYTRVAPYMKWILDNMEPF